MNSIFVIHLYEKDGIWMFDDANVGLLAEPFVGSTNKIIDESSKHIPQANLGFNLFFATQPFPGYQLELNWRREEVAGHWYYADNLDLEGWLCPAMFKYFEKPPQKIYALFEAINSST
jgi:hypothetical protein